MSQFIDLNQISACLQDEILRYLKMKGPVGAEAEVRGDALRFMADRTDKFLAVWTICADGVCQKGEFRADIEARSLYGEWMPEFRGQLYSALDESISGLMQKLVAEAA